MGLRVNFMAGKAICKRGANRPVKLQKLFGLCCYLVSKLASGRDYEDAD